MDELIIIPGASTCSQRCNILYINEFTAQHNRMKNHSTAKRKARTIHHHSHWQPFKGFFQVLLELQPTANTRFGGKGFVCDGQAQCISRVLFLLGYSALSSTEGAFEDSILSSPKVLLMAPDSALSPLNLAMVGCLPTTTTPVLLTEMSKPTTQPLSGA